jgi:hypothetical protein
LGSFRAFGADPRDASAHANPRSSSPDSQLGSFHHFGAAESSNWVRSDRFKVAADWVRFFRFDVASARENRVRFIKLGSSHGDWVRSKEIGFVSNAVGLTCHSADRNPEA